MTRRDPADNHTLQDDRAELEADPHEDSPLVEGEGAPLAEDDVPQDEKPAPTQLLLGGAPIVITPEDYGPSSSGGSLTTPDDRPIND